MIAEIRIVHYVDEHISDPRPMPSDEGVTEYQLMRNRLIDVCASYGSVGPLGKWTRTPEFGEWEDGDECADFWITEEQANSERYLYVHISDPEKISLPWLGDIVIAFSDVPDWGVCVTNIQDGYIIIFAHMMLVNGLAFSACYNSYQCVAAMCQGLAKKQK